MGYYVIDPADIDPMEGRSAEARSISEAAGLETLGLRVYQAAPGEQIPLAYHYHDEQEEGFYVLEGVLHIETTEGELVVEPGECFVAEPNSPHRAYNPDGSDSVVRVVAVGAPSVPDAHEYDPEED